MEEGKNELICPYWFILCNNEKILFFINQIRLLKLCHNLDHGVRNKSFFQHERKENPNKVIEHHKRRMMTSKLLHPYKNPNPFFSMPLMECLKKSLNVMIVWRGDETYLLPTSKPPALGTENGDEIVGDLIMIKEYGIGSPRERNLYQLFFVSLF